MKFLGKFDTIIDDKNRLVIPAKWREQLGKKIILTKGYDFCLTLRKEEDFQLYYQKTFGQIDLHLTENRAIMRDQLANCANLILDKSARFVIPQNLSKLVMLNKKIVLVGMGEFIEIWNQDHYYQNQQQYQEKLVFNR